MTPARTSIVGTITALGLLQTFARRALIFGVLLLICVVLALFPERYRAAVTLTPTDPQSLGLSGTLGQLGAINSAFGNQAAIEVALRVGESVHVRNQVIAQLKLEDRLDMDQVHANRWLERKVDVRTLRGGIIQIDMQDRDFVLAHDIVAAWAGATRDRLAEISREQTAYKRQILVKLVSDTSDDLAKAQAAYDTFRLKNRSADPSIDVEVVSQRISADRGIDQGQTDCPHNCTATLH